MDTRLLRSFLALAEERHFGRAAQRLHIAQPALSQQLKALERDAGVRLVDRSTRSVELTEAGRLLQSRAREIVAALDRTATDLDLMADGRAGHVRLGFVGTATYDVLPRVAQRIRAELPDLDLELHGELLAPELLDRVASGELDLAVTRPGRGPHGPASGVRWEELRVEPMVAVLPAGHRLAGRRRIRLAELSGDTLVAHPSGQRSIMQPLIVDACRAAGFDPDVIEVGETATLVAFVAAGLGVALVPSSVRALRLDGATYVPLVGTPLTVPLGLAHRDRPGAAVARVAAIVRAVAEQ